jgi:serine protease inhibitor
MKIFKQVLLAPLVTALFTLGCTNDENLPPFNEVNPVEIPAAIADGSSRFAFNFLHNLQKNQPAEDNFFVSPLSLHMALGMLLNGAENESAAEIQKALEMQGVSLEDLNKAYNTLIKDLPVADSRVSLGLANSIWYKNGLNVETSFQNVLKESFQAEITGLPFDDSSKERINKWASDKTNGKIKTVIQTIERDHLMFLLNALYFKADWKARFDPKETIDMPFKLENGSSKTVKMMRIKSAFKVAGGTTFGAVRLPYGNGQFTMTLLLPTAGNTIDAVLSELDAEKWKTIISGNAENNVKVGLPRFTLDYSKKLNETLYQMGIKKAFSNIEIYTYESRFRETGCLPGY